MTGPPPGGAEALAVGVVDRARKGAGTRVSGDRPHLHHRVSQGIAELERALAIDRISLRLTRSSVLPSASSGALKRRKPMSTTRSDWSSRHVCLSLADLTGCRGISGKDEEAVSQVRQAIEINRNFHPAHFYLAAALRASAGSTRRASRRRRGFPSIPPSPSAATAPMRRATTRSFSPGGSASRTDAKGWVPEG